VCVWGTNREILWFISIFKMFTPSQAALLAFAERKDLLMQLSLKIRVSWIHARPVFVVAAKKRLGPEPEDAARSFRACQR